MSENGCGCGNGCLVMLLVCVVMACPPVGIVLLILTLLSSGSRRD